jgi:chromosome segregation ATPase
VTGQPEQAQINPEDDLRKHIKAMRGSVWDSYAESAEESLDALAAHLRQAELDREGWEGLANQYQYKRREAEARLRQAEQVIEAAQALSHFLEHEKVTAEPPRELLDQHYVALETSADYEREEELGIALGDALAAYGPAKETG